MHLKRAVKCVLLAHTAANFPPIYAGNANQALTPTTEVLLSARIVGLEHIILPPAHPVPQIVKSVSLAHILPLVQFHVLLVRSEP